MLTHSKESAAPPQHPPKLFLNYPYFSPFSSSLSLLFSPSSSHPSSLFCPSLILPPLYYNVIMFCSCRRINMIICNGCKSYLALQSIYIFDLSLYYYQIYSLLCVIFINIYIHCHFIVNNTTYIPILVLCGSNILYCRNDTM